MLSASTKLGPYEIIAPIGAGGMGEVYRAKDTRLDREVAVKVLSERLANNADALARFEREAKSVAALSHPNILAIHDVGHEGGIDFVVTELLEGETLRERLRRSAVPWRKAVEYGIAVADGLAAAHAKGIIHRDIKPENLFLTKDGVVKILDFGLARVARVANTPAELLGDTPTLTLDTRPGTVLGTVNYMSPEQISGRATDARTDIFSFGCVLYELISGRRAFGGKSVAEITTALLRDEPTTLSDSGQMVPVELDRVIMRCHEKKPEQRIQSARDLSFALRDLLSDSGPSKPAGAHHGLRSRTMFGVQLAVGVVAIVALLLALNVGGWRKPPISGPQVGAITSLAVLPLENISRDPEQEYFVDGMTEALISDLAKIGGLKVISRTSVMRYKATTKSLPEIARELNVDAVVEGSVLQVGDRVRITAQLIQAATDEHLWGESYDRDLRDVLRLQSEVARTIAQEVKVTLTPQEQARMVEPRPINRDAYQAYLKGRFYWNNRTSDDLKKAVEYFEQAIALAPDWPLGYAGLAGAYAVMPQYSSMRSSEAMPKAKAAAVKALEMDESLGEAHATMGLIANNYDWDWPTAEREYKRAIALSPNYATAHHWYALYLMHMGRFDESLKEMTKAQELDPLSLIIGSVVGMVQRNAGHLDQAEIELRKTLELGPDFSMAHINLAITLFLQGRSAQAITEAREAVRLSNNAHHHAGFLGYMCAKAGQPEEARKILDELVARSADAYVAPTHLALVHAGLDERDRMFDWLEKAYQERDALLPNTLINPFLADMRSDPRFADLVRRVGLPPLNPIPPATSSSKPHSEKIMLAVLPFENLSRDPEQVYFSDGLTDEMIARMSRLNPKKLGVIARTSAMHYKNTAQTIDAIGRALGVTFILEGNVRREGDRVRINAQLIQVSDQTQLWAESYERDLKDIFALQDEVAQRIAGSLTVELLSGADSTSPPTRPINVEAYQAYLKGRFFWNQRTPDGLQNAVEYFEQAIALAPDWPLAYAGLADAYLVMPFWAPVRSSEAMPKAKAAAATALELDESLAEAHVSRAYIATIYDWDFPTAEREYERAIALSPNYATGHYWYALHLMFTSRWDAAMNEINKAQALDPLSLIIGATVGGVHYRAGDFIQAENVQRKTLELGPDFPVAYDELARTLTLQGRLAEAITQAQEAVRLSNNSARFVAVLGCLRGRAGQLSEARSILKELVSRSNDEYVAAIHLALVYAGLDERDQMFDCLERAYLEHEVLLLSTLTDPLLAPLRSDPRFVDLVRRLGLPPLIPIPSATSSSKPPSEK